MDETLETQLYNTLKRNPNLQKIKKSIEDGVDCNLSHFDGSDRIFISPIQLAAKNDRHNTLPYLYEHRNSPTKEQLRKHWQFYINHHDRSQRERNKTLFDYTVSRLLYARITQHSKNVFDTLIAALHDYDNAKYRGQSLSEGSRLEVFLQLRIYTLFRKIIDMRLDSDSDMRENIEKELLHNLETYYFLMGILVIPVVITKRIISQRFSIIKLSKPLLIKYYECIAKNVISKIQQLEINEEYTIPTGWIKHAVCVSFQRISQTHIVIRIDNPTPSNPLNTHKIVFSTIHFDVIKPKVLGQLHVNNLEENLNYFIALIGSVKRDLTPEEGSSLIYNLNGQILNLHEAQIDVPCFIEQADANCFVKCFEPGFWIRFGERHQRLYQHLLILEKHNADLFASRCVEEHQHYFNDLFNQFTLSAELDDMSNLPIEQKTRIQNTLKMSYKQHYKQLLSNVNTEHCPLLDEKYVPLRFKNNNIPIELKNLSTNSRVLIFGEAGCGKTTVCQYITYSWAIGKKLRPNQFEWLFYIKMRNLNSKLYPKQSNNYSLVDIIDTECFQEHKLDHLDKQKLTNELENSSNILWILDGCDERTIPTYLQFIEQELLAKRNLLLTSRPYATDDLLYDAKIEIQNFTDQDIEKYVYNYFSFTLRTIGRQCWSRISESDQLLETARIPACLEIICSLWENGKETLHPRIKKGELYQKMCDYLLQRYLLKFHRLCNSAVAGRDIYQEPNAVVFANLEYLAFEATKAHRLTISGHKINNVAGLKFLSVSQVILLISKTRDPSLSLLENVYYFVHRSFQEHLSARYMIRVLESSSSTEQMTEVLQFITYEKYNRRVRDIFRLFFELEPSISCTNQFWEAIDSEPRDLVGLRHCSRIAHCFPQGSCIFRLEDQQKIDTRTIEIIQSWISERERLPHDIGNKYIFEWFASATGDQCWLKARKEDLYIKDSSKRRYFLPDLWSTQNIDVLKEIYNDVSGDIEALHSLITIGPNRSSVKRLKLESNLFTLYTIDNQTETSEFVIAAQERARRHEPITTLADFCALLQNYTSFANLNRQSTALGSITWKLTIAPSALENINNRTLHLLLQLIQKHALFFRYFKLPVRPFLKLYTNQNDLTVDILLLIVLITVSSDCILTAAPDQKRLIRVHEKDTYVDIEMDEHRRSSLLHAFDEARDAYGYSSFLDKMIRFYTLINFI